MSLFERETEALETLFSGIPSTALSLDGIAPAPAGKGAGLILQNAVYAELGTPETTESAQIALYSNVVGPDSVKLIGPALETLRGKAVSFAQVIVLRGEKIDVEAYYRFLQRQQRLLDHPGWMVKSAKGRIWIRTATVDGAAPDFAQAAATYIARIKTAFPEVEGVEIFFITENEDLVGRLAERAAKQIEEARAIKEGVWKERGFDYKSCQLAGHCGGCADKKTCATVRKIEARVRIHRREEAQQRGASAE